MNIEAIRKCMTFIGRFGVFVLQFYELGKVCNLSFYLISETIFFPEMHFCQVQ